MRSVISRGRNRLRSAALALGLALAALGGASARGDEVSLSLPQARDLAGLALDNNDPGLALKVARELIKADPTDAFAHYVMAVAYARLNQPRDGRKAAARAYRYSTSDADRMQVSTLAARLAVAEDRPTIAQLWLRRASLYTQSDVEDERLARDYRILRQRNPWSFSIRTEVRPSDNVNNGPDRQYMELNGSQLPISGATRALSGTVGTLDTSLGYRLSGSATHQTTLSGRLYVRRVALSGSAKAQAPMATGSDYGATYGELSLRHAFVVGPEGKGDTAAVSLALGDSWYGGDHSFGQAQVTFEREWQLGGNRSFDITLLAAQRYDAPNPSNDGRTLGFGTSLNQKLGNGDRLSLSLYLRDVEAEFDNGTYQSALVRASYGFARQLGPAKVTAGLSIGRSDYPLLYLNSGIYGTYIGPRDDRSIYGDLTFFFSDYDYAGFAPTVRLRAGHSDSNIDIYSSREVSISLGLQSKF
ncbi:tetratricopeptide repeat protein [Albibacillus kandeliae]|uniref:hypothetical protein n=1 Tax=Albibacillus kandeliae TaxID=2174228 RepID=UPI000D688C88|nr:hypothetical protein [Albibacillus kandeliae]